MTNGGCGIETFKVNIKRNQINLSASYQVKLTLTLITLLLLLTLITPFHYLLSGIHDHCPQMLLYG